MAKPTAADIIRAIALRAAERALREPPPKDPAPIDPEASERSKFFAALARRGLEMPPVSRKS